MAQELVEGVDYTIDPETGLLIFTRAYLEKRGYCCASGCQNCPYGYVTPPTGKPGSGSGSGKGPVSS